MRSEQPLRIKGCLAREDEKEFIKIDVSSEEDFYRLAASIGSPIFDCTATGITFIIDPEKKIQYRLKQ